MGDVIAVNDVVVPVSLARLQSRVLEAKSALPGARLGRRLVSGEWELAHVIVPGAEEVDGLDAGGDAEGKGKLNGGHYCLLCSLYES